MSLNSKIEWTDATWNPIAGCTKCSPGCLNCYAEKRAHRLKHICLATNNNPQYLGKTDDDGKWTGEVECCDWILNQPLHWLKPRRIFVCSMSDLFHPKVPEGFIDKVHAAMIMAVRRGKYHTYLILTKRIKRMLEYYSSNRRPQLYAILEKDYDEITGFFGINWPFPTLHLGVSISNQDEIWKARVLADIPAAVKFISFEPLLEDIIDVPVEVMNKIDGCIIGCESGPNRREFDNQWALRLVADFHHFNKTVFVKQISIDGRVVKMPKEFPQEYPERR